MNRQVAPFCKHKAIWLAQCSLILIRPHLPLNILRCNASPYFPGLRLPSCPTMYVRVDGVEQAERRMSEGRNSESGRKGGRAAIQGYRLRASNGEALAAASPQPPPRSI